MLNKPYLSVQEMLEKTVKQRKQIRDHLDNGSFYQPIANIYQGQNQEDTHLLYETIHNLSLAELIANTDSTSTGAYLIPDKISDIITFFSQQTDKTPLISRQIINGWEGGPLKVPIFPKNSYKANIFSSGGTIPDEDITGGTSTQATLTPISFAVNPAITNDMVEDTPGLVEYHLSVAAEAMGMKSTNLALDALKAGADGCGTLNSSATGDADQTKFIGGTTADISDAINAVGVDEWYPDTMLITNHAWFHSVQETLGIVTTVNAVSAAYWKFVPDIVEVAPLAPGFDFKLQTLDCMWLNYASMHKATDAAGTFADCVTLVFDRSAALLTGRKRWLEVANYAEPVRDLAGCTITARQDSVTLYNDAIYKLTET